MRRPLFIRYRRVDVEELDDVIAMQVAPDTTARPREVAEALGSDACQTVLGDASEIDDSTLAAFTCEAEPRQTHVTGTPVLHKEHTWRARIVT